MDCKTLLTALILHFAVLTNCQDNDGKTYTNPVMEDNRPDPGVLKLSDGSGFAAVSTSNYAFDNDAPAFPIMFSSDLIHWEEVTVVYTKPIIVRF